jgi:Ca-activated chloride channel homolog
MKTTLLGMAMACAIGGCATGTTTAVPRAAGPATPAPSPLAPAVVAGAPLPDAPKPRTPSGPWIGAAGASDFVLAGTNDTSLGVWVDVPLGLAQRSHAPAAIALVIDTSGSMAGAKIENARAAARDLIDKLADGDIVALDTFSDEAVERVPPTVLSASTRPTILRAVAQLEPSGGTNMFDGLRLGEGRVLNAPPTHPVRRLVVISDGIANVGPSSPEVLGALAARGADGGVQITSVGVGIDYDEHTLDALAVRSSGRLYHLSDPGEMASILEHELTLLQETAATGAFIEIVPAPGVQVLGADGARADWEGKALRVPLGTMFGGQHREMLVRVRITPAGDGSRPLASVRLHFRDPADGNLERVQEVVARYQVTTDPGAVEKHANETTRTIAAVQQAGQMAIAAAQDVSEGRFRDADKSLEMAEAHLRDMAVHAVDEDARKRAVAAASTMTHARASARAAAVAPAAAAPAARREKALEMNADAMQGLGY